jgi:uncharacterized protein (DUF3820 family)
MNKINTNNLIVEFGKHKGQLWTRIPVDYLQWLINQKNENNKHKKDFDCYKKIAVAELDRRGTNLRHDVEITPHAVDKASLRLRKIWHQTCNENEGIYTWLSRVASQAIVEKGKNEIIRYIGIKFIFKIGNNYPILKTVILLKEL